MRIISSIAAVALLSGAACTSSEPDASAPSEHPSFAHVPDLSGLPDIIVDGPTLAHSWVIYDETFSPTACDVIEGGVSGGDHRALRLTVNTPNIGTADLYVGDPNVHIDPNGDGDFSDSDGLFEFAACHHHYHFRHYATYELLPILADGSVGAPIASAKRGFCMIDVAPFNSDATEPKAWVYRSCGQVGVAGNQGISTGWADQYYKWLQGQYFIIDGQPAGPYLIRIHVNPPFTAQAGEPCPVTDLAGFCHQFTESDYGNNVAEVRIEIPATRPGKTGYGPGGGQNVPSNKDGLIDDENRPSK